MVDNQRQADARRRHELAAAAAQAEAIAAQSQLDAFVATVRGAGVEPEPLRATLLNGARVKTDRHGWYLNAGQTLAVGPDGSYYSLVVPGGMLSRWRGVQVPAVAPTLVIGRGGRDGETGDLRDFLARALQRYLPGAAGGGERP